MLSNIYIRYISISNFTIFYVLFDNFEVQSGHFCPRVFRVSRLNKIVYQFNLIYQIKRDTAE